MTRATAEPRRALSLGARTFLVTAALIALAMAVAIAVTAVLGQRIARSGIDRALANAGTAQAAFQRLRDERLRLTARALASDPFLVAYIAQAAELVETRSILDILYERQRETGADLIVALDPRGRALARTDAPDASGEDLAGRPLVAAALAEHDATGVWDERGTLYEAVVVPLLKGLDLIGYLAVGSRIDEEMAREAKSISGTDVVVLSHAGGAPRAVASTLPAEAAAAVAAAFGRGEADLGRAAPSREIRLAGAPWLARAVPLGGAPARPAGALVLLASLHEAMATYRQIETVLVVVGLVAMLLAFAVSYPLSRRLLHPVRRLADAADAARRGDYAQAVEAGGDDEVARLARSFRSLLADLREKRDMEAYLTNLAQNVGAAAAPRTTPLAVPSEQPTLALDQATPGPGALLGGRYEVLEVLGSGGMGIVLKAHDRHVDGVVALKLLKPSLLADSEQLERMRGEIRLARRVTHANVLRTYDFDILDGRPVISMEYVHGMTLRRLLTQSGRLPYLAGLHLARQMCAGLAAAHAEGVLHRDIKPENLILQQSGNAKLADFGIARSLRREGASPASAETRVGTPSYMAPEVLRGLEPDARADLYAVGVVLHEIFTGERPFEAGSLAEVVSLQLERPAPPPRERWPGMPEPLERLILRCLERDRDRRHASVVELLAELESLRDAMAPPPPPGAAAGRLAAVALLAIAGAALALPAAAADPGSARPRVWLTGDVRLRAERVQGLPLGRADLERARALARLGLAASPAPPLELAVLGKGALGSDENRDNPINFDNEKSDAVSLDAAWVRFEPAGGAAIAAGKRAAPFWLTPLVWDDDLRPLGVAATYRRDVRTYDELRLAAGGFATQHLHGDATRVAGAQVAWLLRPGAPTRGEALLGYLHFSKLEELPPTLYRQNRVSAGALASDFRLLDAQLALRVPLGPTSATLRLDLVRNLGADADDDAVRVLLACGGTGRAGAVELAYAYQRIERDAVLAAVNGDDWWFHSRSRGHMLRAEVGITSWALARLTGFVERRDDLGRDTRRVRLELEAAR